MKIVHISDTHGKHHLLNLPKADVLVHSGDFTFGGAEDEAYDFMNWLCDLSYKHIIFIAGNHDNCMYGAECIEGLPENVHYLCNSSVVIENKLFYGVPMFMEDVLKGNYDSMFDNIPLETDVLVTHQPPYGILDGGEYHGEPCHYGEELLQQKVMEVKPRAHLFGHVHNMFDTIVQNDIIFSNAALLDDHYNLCAGLRTIEL